MASAAAPKKCRRPSQPWGFGADQPQVGFVDQLGGLDGLPGCFVGQSPGGQTAQFVVNQRDQILGRFPLAPLNRLQDDGDVSHGCVGSSINAMASGKALRPAR